MESNKFIRTVGIAAVLALAAVGLQGQAVHAATSSVSNSQQSSAANAQTTSDATASSSSKTATGTTTASKTATSTTGTTKAAATTSAKATTTTTQTTTPALSGVTSATGVVTVPAGSFLQSGPGKGYSVLRSLAANSTWKYFAVRDYQGYFWYDLGGNQWVRVSKTATPATKAPSKTASSAVTSSGTIKLPISAALQAGPGNGYRVIKQLSAGSSWKYFAIRSNYEGKTWYDLGGNQWVGVKPGQKAAAPSMSGLVKASGVVRMNAARKLQAGPGHGYRVIKTLPYGSTWKYFAIRYYQGLNWYDLGGGKWVSVDPHPSVVDWHGPSEVDHAYPNLNAYPHAWIKVSLAKQRVYIMNGNTVLYTMLCSTGRPGDATPTGVYAIQRERGPVFGGSLGGARYYVSWKDHGVYLFHSVPINGRGQYLASEGALLGKRPHSHGCIRLTVSDAYWMYTHIKYGTKVVVQK